MLVATPDLSTLPEKAKIAPPTMAAATIAPNHIAPLLIAGRGPSLSRGSVRAGSGRAGSRAGLFGSLNVMASSVASPIWNAVGGGRFNAGTTGKAGPPGKKGGRHVLEPNASSGFIGACAATLIWN